MNKDAKALLLEVAATLDERGKQYETDPSAQGKERSMTLIVEAFKLITGKQLTAREGWLFMVCLKLVRMQASPNKLDTYVDGVAYLALAAECVDASSPLAGLSQQEHDRIADQVELQSDDEYYDFQ